MAVAVIMPKQGQSVESCIITKWCKAVGDAVSAGDILFEYETDKAAFEEEAKESGILLAILAEEGDDVPCLENVAVIGAEGDDISAFTAGAQSEEAAPAEEVPVAKEEVVAAVSTASERVEGERIFISPRAKNKAESMRLDYTLAIPTGPNGRIMERDIIALSNSGIRSAVAEVEPTADVVEKQIQVAAPEAEFEDVKLSGVRKAIAKNMHESLSSMAQLTHHFSFDATDILNFRKQVKEKAELLGLVNITLNDIILYAVSRVLKNHPDMNAHFLGDKMRLFKTVNLGMAVDTNRGLLVPTIFGADKMSLNEIAAAAKEEATAAQEGSISPDLLTGATFTVSNLGALNVEMFTPVINPPQVGIIGVCNIQYKLKKDGSTYPAMGLSLTYDHRAVDGAPASRFMSELCRALESFSVLLAK